MVEDEALRELGRLQQGVLFADVFAEVLVEVAEETGVPGGVCEVVAQLAAVLVAFAPEGEQVCGAVAADEEAEEGVVAVVEKRLGGGKGGHLFNNGQQVMGFICLGSVPEKEA